MSKKRLVVFFVVFLLSLVIAAAVDYILTTYYNELVEPWKTVYAIVLLAAAVSAILFGILFALGSKSGGRIFVVSGLCFVTVIVILSVILQHPTAGDRHIATDFNVISFYGLLTFAFFTLIWGILRAFGKKIRIE